jgi:hypothetical protein
VEVVEAIHLFIDAANALAPLATGVAATIAAIVAWRTHRQAKANFDKLNEVYVMVDGKMERFEAALIREKAAVSAVSRLEGVAEGVASERDRPAVPPPIAVPADPFPVVLIKPTKP